MTRYTTNALAKKYGIPANKLRLKFQRHGIRPDKNGKFTDADYLKAKQMGAAMDKSKLAEQAEDLAPQVNPSMPSASTLTYARLQRQIKKLDIDIQMAQVELDEALGKSVPIDKHKETLQGVVAMMQSWWDKASEAAATKIKDATVLKHLREARERANDEIMAILDS
jgi:hypothetical protein